MKFLISKYFAQKVMIATKTLLYAPLSQGKIGNYHDSMLHSIEHLHNNTENKVAPSTEE
jgi:hypothetical protein